MRNSPLIEISGSVAPLLRSNIDTDAICPSRVPFRVDEDDASRFLFREWRFDAHGAERPDFILNQADRRHSVFLIALDNFGCGSSRETAPWALRDFGIRCVIAPSFGGIFQSNCYRNGIAPLILDRPAVERLGHLAEVDPKIQFTLDMKRLCLSATAGDLIDVVMEPGPRRMLMTGLDEIDQTLERRGEIESFRAEGGTLRPWAYL